MKNVFSNRNPPIVLLVEVSFEHQQVNDCNSIPTSVSFVFLVLLNTELKILENQNDEIRHEINRCHSDLRKYDEKLQILDNMTHLATQSLEVYFQTVRKIFLLRVELIIAICRIANGKSPSICDGTMSSYCGWNSRRS